MVLKLRLARVSTPTGAKRHQPFYNIVLMNSRTARDAKPMEVLGTYDPIPKLPVGADPGDRRQKDIKIDVSRAKYWLGVGAQPSDTVWRLLAMIGLLEPRYLPHGPQTLKAVRFPTHVPKSEKLGQSDTEAHKGGIMERINSEIQAGRSQDGANAGTTSPSDPNAA
ncbi:Ribosomal S16, mitochondrial [Lecanosticta acicola]|uniref:Ribosomal S16, mitochondrial n=1 Tax=Lecanosticta acicola TaxID=111012 RepID=A0AAI9EAN2_9PEZI|nr:Ribosomal S16, mitochondrial [Lecanosticta acicola]